MTAAASIRPRRGSGLQALAAALLWAAPLNAQKADTVILRNGDRIVGELKALDRGAVSYLTDDMGTLAIQWDKIDRIISDRYFEVEVGSGERYYGALQRGIQVGQVVVAVASFSDTLDQAAIVRINPIGRSFLARVDGSIALSLSFQRANRLRAFGVEADARHRSTKWLTEVRSSVYFQAQEGAEGTSRNSVSLGESRFLPQRWLLVGTGSAEQNEELALDLRVLVSAGGGRFLRQSNRAYLLVGSGLAYANERYTGSSPTSNLEALVSAAAEYFRLDSPKSNLRGALTVYPSITDFGRVRSDLDVSLTHEVIKDFTIGLTLFDKFDSRPPAAGAAKHDYGVAFTTGWTF